MIPPDWKCPLRVGFLFPHPCDRMTPIGCPDCQNGQITDPYRQRDRGSYGDYDDYDDSVYETFGIAGAASDFTEADGEALVKPDQVFEDDMSAS
ncbi:MAG TPA: hypothetical protein VKU01_06680 [Bryobacteraceae bacterium]|nr:hypothetical protein [Bryobacteraceae bacterium]